MPEVQEILGRNFIGIANEEEDQQHNTDLIVLRMDGLRFGCRIRKHAYYKTFPNDFTIRFSLPSGGKTEYEKILEGWGDYLFYGFANEAETSLHLWRIIDFERFRAFVTWYKSNNNDKIPGMEQKNSDQSSTFRAFNVKEKYMKSLVFNEGGPGIAQVTCCLICQNPKIFKDSLCENCYIANQAW